MDIGKILRTKTERNVHSTVDIEEKNILQHKKTIVHKNVDIGAMSHLLKGDVKAKKLVWRKTGDFVFVAQTIFEILRY